jgi:predicted flap endonuclease-1-like 5' DNA nuclease
MWRLFLRRRADEHAHSYSQSSPAYSLSSTPPPVFPPPEKPSSARGSAGHDTPPATDKPSEEPAASLDAPVGAIAPPPAGATNASGAPAPAGDDYMPAEEAPAVPEQPDDAPASAAPPASEAPDSAATDTARDATPADGAPGGQEAPAEPAPPDDLLAIEGIGPKISTIVVAAGITSFADLAAADVGRLESILSDAGIHTANPSTWPQQAQLAANGQWDELRQLQERIKNGRIEE